MVEEENKLLDKVKEGIMPAVSGEPKKEIEANTKEEITKILSELKQKMMDIDRITSELEKKRNALSKSSPSHTQKLLEEIKVPPLEIIK
ncbi:MAG: hypothetical protein WC290_03135 [archaeon]|jgi:hypothetical protein